MLNTNELKLVKKILHSKIYSSDYLSKEKRDMNAIIANIISKIDKTINKEKKNELTN